VVQINHLRTHPSVASALARGELSLHGWFVDIETGEILALDGETGRFVAVTDDSRAPVAVAPARRLAAEHVIGIGIAAE
jgi:carbonic anhydrase